MVLSAYTRDLWCMMSVIDPVRHHKTLEMQKEERTRLVMLCGQEIPLCKPVIREWLKCANFR